MRSFNAVGLLRMAVWCALCLSFLAVMPASAQVQAVIFVDENGNGSFQVNGGASNPLAAFFGPDPSGGLAGNVLYYQLPFPLLGLGDVLLTEQPVGQGLAQNSDVVRFFQTVVNQTTFNYLIFYSDNGDGGEDLADTGLPSELSSNLVTIPEVGPEGNNGVVYTPSAGNPGARDGAVEYDIISDSPVPEPSTVALTGVGLLAAALLARRRRRA